MHTPLSISDGKPG